MELGILVHYGLQLLLAKTVSINVVQGFVKEFTPLSEHIFVSSDNRLFTKFHMEVALLLVTEPDAVLARLLLLFGRAVGDHVDLLINFVSFLENVLLCGVEPGFERLEHRNHKSGVLRVIPAVRITIHILRPILALNLFLHPEVDLEHVNEVGKEEATIDVCLDVIR